MSLLTSRCFIAPRWSSGRTSSYERAAYLKRLAFYTITEEEAAQFEWVHLTCSKPEEIDVLTTMDEVDVEAIRRALDCYVTYAETIQSRQIPATYTCSESRSNL